MSIHIFESAVLTKFLTRWQSRITKIVIRKKVQVASHFPLDNQFHVFHSPLIQLRINFVRSTQVLMETVTGIQKLPNSLYKRNKP